MTKVIRIENIKKYYIVGQYCVKALDGITEDIYSW